MALMIVAGGSGRHAAVVYEAALLAGVPVAGFATVIDGQSKNILDCRYLGKSDEISGPAIERGIEFIVACGSNDLRRSIMGVLAAQGASFRSILHPAAMVSPSATIGGGSVLLAGAIVGSRATLGRGTIVNHAASVDHDCLVGDYANISPGARLGGHVRAGAGVFVGLNASIIQGLQVGENAIVGAGAVVTKDVEPGTTVVGVPARPIRSP